MPKFDSPIGGRQFSGQQMREFDVPDGEEQPINTVPRGNRLGGYAPPQINFESAMEFSEKLESEEEAAFEREVKAAREAKRSGKTRLNEGARRRIEMLVGMSRTTRDCDIGGHKYSLQTLSSKEMRAAIMSAAAFGGSVQEPFEIRRQLLAHSLTFVAGLDIVQFVGSNDFEAKLELIDSLDEALLNRLYDEYLTMVKEAREKYTIKNQEDAKEIVEDLKK